MKIWRWLLAFMFVGTVAVACGSDPAPRDTDEETNEGGGTNTTTMTTTMTGTTTTSTMMSCASQPDYGSCVDCFCTEDPTGCDAWDTVLVDNLACGQSCGAGACANFCADPATNPLDQPCIACANAIEDDPNSTTDDIDNLIADCQASPACIGFAQTLGACPDPV